MWRGGMEPLSEWSVSVQKLIPELLDYSDSVEPNYLIW